MSKSYEDLCKCMQQRGKEYSGYLKDLNDLNNEVLEKTDALLTEFDKMKEKKSTCPICYTRSQTHTFQPCGHCTCQPCSERALTRNRCFTCRSPVEGIMRIYI